MGIGTEISRRPEGRRPFFGLAEVSRWTWSGKGSNMHGSTGVADSFSLKPEQIGATGIDDAKNCCVPSWGVTGREIRAENRFPGFCRSHRPTGCRSGRGRDSLGVREQKLALADVGAVFGQQGFYQAVVVRGDHTADDRVGQQREFVSLRADMGIIPVKSSC